MGSKGKFGAALVALGAIAMLSGPTSAQSSPADEAVVRKFYEAAINAKDFEVASRYLGPTYRQHNPNAADGVEGLRAFITRLKRDLPDYHSEILRVFSDNGHVILHVRNKATPGSRGTAIIDIFRLEKGKIVEHWDVRQDVPEKTANNNGMF